MSKPDTKYQMMYGGEYRPVTNMFDRGNNETNNPLHAAKIVLYLSDDEFCAVITQPGDIVRRDGRRPDSQQWDVI